MTDEKALSVLTDGERRVVREMIQYSVNIKNWKWNRKPLLLGVAISICGFLSTYFWFLIDASEKGQLGKISEAELSPLMSTVIGGTVILLAMAALTVIESVIVGLLIYFLFFKWWRDRSIVELSRIQQQVPEARSAIEKLKICFTRAEDIRKLSLAHEKFPQPSRALRRLITESIRQS